MTEPVISRWKLPPPALRKARSSFKALSWRSWRGEAHHRRRGQSWPPGLEWVQHAGQGVQHAAWSSMRAFNRLVVAGAPASPPCLGSPPTSPPILAFHGVVLKAWLKFHLELPWAWVLLPAQGQDAAGAGPGCCRRGFLRRDLHFFGILGLSIGVPVHAQQHAPRAPASVPVHVYLGTGFFQQHGRVSGLLFQAWAVHFTGISAALSDSLQLSLGPTSLALLRRPPRPPVLGPRSWALLRRPPRPPVLGPRSRDIFQAKSQKELRDERSLPTIGPGPLLLGLHLYLDRCFWAKGGGCFWAYTFTWTAAFG